MLHSSVRLLSVFSIPSLASESIQITKFLVLLNLNSYHRSHWRLYNLIPNTIGRLIYITYVLFQFFFLFCFTVDVARLQCALVPSFNWYLITQNFIVPTHIHLCSCLMKLGSMRDHSPKSESDHMKPGR